VVTEKNPDPEVAIRSVTTLHGRVYVRDRSRDEPAVVLMNGLPIAAGRDKKIMITVQVCHAA